MNIARARGATEIRPAIGNRNQLGRARLDARPDAKVFAARRGRKGAPSRGLIGGSEGRKLRGKNSARYRTYVSAGIWFHV